MKEQSVEDRMAEFLQKHIEWCEGCQSKVWSIDMQNHIDEGVKILNEYRLKRKI